MGGVRARDAWWRIQLPPAVRDRVAAAAKLLTALGDGVKTERSMSAGMCMYRMDDERERELREIERGVYPRVRRVRHRSPAESSRGTQYNVDVGCDVMRVQCHIAGDPRVRADRAKVVCIL